MNTSHGTFSRLPASILIEKAIAYAKQNFNKGNLLFEEGDAMGMKYDDGMFDVVICSQVYEHVPDAEVLMDEALRVLRPGGVVYFAAGNRIMFNEPHYNLPLLSLLPRPLAHLYVKLSGKGESYYEKHFTYWGLKRLARKFRIVDFTARIIGDPDRYGAAYMVPPGSNKQKIAVFISKYFLWLVPGYIWVLVKPDK
jgi:SAM-dependent methyltransferase